MMVYGKKKGRRRRRKKKGKKRKKKKKKKKHDVDFYISFFDKILVIYWYNQDKKLFTYLFVCEILLVSL